MPGGIDARKVSRSIDSLGRITPDPYKRLLAAPENCGRLVGNPEIGICGRCSVSTNWRLLGTVHEFESTRSQMDSITMATAIRSKKWKATASPGVKIEKLEPGHVAEAGD